MKTRNLLTTSLFGIVALPLLMAAQPASATFTNNVQYTHYAGASCQPTNASNAEHAQVDSKGRIFNTSPTQVLAVNCTVTRDPFEGKSTGIKMFVIDQKAQPGNSLTCKFSMVSPLTGQVARQSLFGTTDKASSPTQGQAIESTFLPSLNIGVLNCFIPPADANGGHQSGIAGYMVTDLQQ